MNPLPLILLGGGAAGLAYMATKKKSAPAKSLPTPPGVPTSPASPTAPVNPAAPASPTPSMNPPGTEGFQAARVTTNDPAPSGDLYIVPSPGAAGIPGVGAEKNGIVYIDPSYTDSNGVYAKVVWPGGRRLRAVTGFAKKRYLVPITTTTSGLGHGVMNTPGRIGTVLCPGGCMVRSRAGSDGETLGMIGFGHRVAVKKVVPGPKAMRQSPGRVGGWSLVDDGHVAGWVQTEWLKID